MTRTKPDKRNHKLRRLGILFGAGIIAVAGVLVYRHFWLSRPVGSGAAGPTVPRARFERPWTDRSVLLVGFGDSITAGFGARQGYSYFDRLTANPPDEFPDMKGVCLSAVLPNLEALNLSVNSSTSDHHLVRQITPFETQDPSVRGLVVMSTGGNDIIHNYGRQPPEEFGMYGATLEQAQRWIDAFELRLHAMIDKIEERFPGGCRIFLANIYDPTDGIGNIEAAGLPAWPDGLDVLRAYNEIIHQCAAATSSVMLVDIHGAFLGHGINCTKNWTKHYRADDPHYWYDSNLEDPNERGYDAIRRLFLLKISEAFSTDSDPDLRLEQGQRRSEK